MHELGIIVHITKTIDEVIEENHLSEIASITLEIGEVSGVVNDYLIDCWKYYRKKFQQYRNTELIIDTKKAITYCEDCHQTYETIKYAKVCPYCNSENTYLLEGNECNIKEIEAI